MRIAMINAVPYGSTGRIMFHIADSLRTNGHETLCTTGFTWKKCNRSDYIMTSNVFEKQFHIILSMVTGRIGCYSYFATKRLINRLKKFSPDIIHMHNLHGWFLNLPMLFDYIKNNKIRVVWTLHDCWAFTGCCPHFDMIGCNQWETECCSCSQYRLYPKCFWDNSKMLYNLKKEWFSGVEDLTIVTPSKWLSNQVKKSFLKDYPVKVINNGIDLSVFTPLENDFKRRYGCEGKYVILGVAYDWSDKKGIDVFLRLACLLDDNYAVVLVGVDENTQRQIPGNIISIRRTESPSELANIYSASDLFVNPTREDTFPTVNIEALACGTPVLTFDTGGSSEIIDSSCGVVVPKNDIDSMLDNCIHICKEKPYTVEDCVKRALLYDKQNKTDEYLKLFGVNI